MRHAAAIAVVLLLTPTTLRAQTVVFKVNTPSANVHKSPSTGSPVVGKASRGAILEVTRELGSWVKVVWPKAQGGIGYVHVSAGSIARAATPDDARTAAAEEPKPASAGPPIPPPAPSQMRASRPMTSAPPRTSSAGYVRPPAHVFGVGGIIGAAPDFEVGAAARLWSRTRFGLQADLSRAAVASDPPRATSSVEFAPSVLYGFRDHVEDYWWLRPYAGAGPTFEHRGFDGVPPGDPIASSAFGFQAFGGGEITFASLPQLAFSMDLGYRWSEALAGIDRSGVRFAVSGHWYLR